MKLKLPKNLIILFSAFLLVFQPISTVFASTQTSSLESGIVNNTTEKYMFLDPDTNEVLSSIQLEEKVIVSHQVELLDPESDNLLVEIPAGESISIIDETEEYFIVKYADQLGEEFEGRLSKENFSGFDNSEGIPAESITDENSIDEDDNAVSGEESVNAEEGKTSDTSEESNDDVTEESVEADKPEDIPEKAADLQKSAKQQITARTSLTVQSQKTYYGVALSNPTKVYKGPSTTSGEWRTYEKGSILKYRSYSSDWYQATVKIDGKWQTGYIRSADVENATDNKETLQGIGTKNPTRVYSSASTSSSTLKSYPQGSILKYKTFTTDWYQATVYVNGKPKTGYIHRSHVENAVKNQETLQGIGKNNPTRVYSRASTSSTSLKSYAQGTVLKYRTFSKDWYQATVYINGKRQTGYIHKNNVENAVKNPETLQGIGINSPTHVYSRASTSSKALKSYAQGSILKYKTFSNNWYQATVYINGKRQTGYIHKSHVDNLVSKQETLNGIAVKNKTNVYTKPSANSKVLKGYNKGSILKYRTFSSNWYEATVYIDGKRYTGYIYAKDVASVLQTNTRYNISLEQALGLQMKVNPQTDLGIGYVSKTYIKNGIVNVDADSSLNVRSSPGGTVIGSLSRGTAVKILGETNGWYMIEYGYKSWHTALPEQVRFYLDPKNFANNSVQKLQFLDLSKPSGISLTALNNYLKGKGILEGKGSVFLKAEKDYNVNAIYLVSHALLETGHGKSRLANGITHRGTKVYNMFGISAYDNCAEDCGAEYAYRQGWTTPEKAILGGAEWIRNNYVHSSSYKQNTVYKMRWNPNYMANYGYAAHQYASDIGWAYKQASTMYELYQQIDSYVLSLDIPVYNN